MKEHFELERWREEGEILRSVRAVSKQLMRAWDELPAPFFKYLNYEHIFFPTDVPLRRNKFHPTTAGALAYLHNNDPEMGAEMDSGNHRKLSLDQFKICRGAKPQIGLAKIYYIHLVRSHSINHVKTNRWVNWIVGSFLRIFFLFFIWLLIVESARWQKSGLFIYF